jgi:hypothetical protein
MRERIGQRLALLVDYGLNEAVKNYTINSWLEKRS